MQNNLPKSQEPIPQSCEYSPKRLVVCCDGTWQEPTNTQEKSHPTNVFRLAQAIPAVDDQGVQQIVYYSRGLGTGGWFNRWLGGFFGAGIDKEILDAYTFLSMNYNEGDEVYLFGFSRGAYTVRSLAGLIYHSGLLPPEQLFVPLHNTQVDEKPVYTRLQQAYAYYRSRNFAPDSEHLEEFRASFGNFQQIPIRLLCCWDSVGALGIPNAIPERLFMPNLERHYGFHDHKLGGQVEYALHAVAMDEFRPFFEVTPMKTTNNTVLEQCFFPGDHGAVGGGTPATAPLANAALLWVRNRIEDLPNLNLRIELQNLQHGGEEAGPLTVDPYNPVLRSNINASWKSKLLWGFIRLFSWPKPREIESLSNSAVAWLSESTGLSRSHFHRLEENTGEPKVIYDLDESLRNRLRSSEVSYKPKALAQYVQQISKLESDRLFDAL